MGARSAATDFDKRDDALLTRSASSPAMPSAGFLGSSPRSASGLKGTSSACGELATPPPGRPDGRPLEVGGFSPRHTRESAPPAGRRGSPIDLLFRRRISRRSRLRLSPPGLTGAPPPWGKRKLMLVLSQRPPPRWNVGAGDGRGVRRGRGAAGDPALVMLGTDARPDTLAAQARNVRFRSAVGRSLFSGWIGLLLTFDLGNSHAHGTSVSVDRRSPGDLAAAQRMRSGRCWSPFLRVRRLGGFARSGRWGVMGFTQIGISVPEFLVRRRAGAAVRGDLAVLPGRRFSRWGQDPRQSYAAAILLALSLVAGDRHPERVTRSSILTTPLRGITCTARA